MAGFDNFPAQGVPFHGEFSAADATTTTLTTESLHRFALYVAGTTAATTIAAGDQVIITDFSMSQSASTVLSSIYDGADNDIGAGELIIQQQRTTNVFYVLSTPHWCQVGSYPKCKSAGVAGQTDVIIRGVIKRAV